MSNMSYCRFQNTLRDFEDCREALEEQVNDTDARPLDEHELRAAKALAYSCLNFLTLIVQEGGGNDLTDLVDSDDAQDQLDAALDALNTDPGLPDPCGYPR